MTRAEMLDRSSRKDRMGKPLPVKLGFVSHDKNRRGKQSRHMTIVGTRGGASHNLYRHGQISIHPLNGTHPVAIHIDLVTHCDGELVI